MIRKLYLALEMAAQFDQAMQDVVACVTTSVLVPRRYELESRIVSF